MEFNFHYKKESNEQLFQQIKEVNLLNISNIQNYIPIYESFFSLNNNNFNNINLNHKYSLFNITKKEHSNCFLGQIIDNEKNITDISIFTKFSPILDPIKYMVGKYDTNNPNLLNLPSFNNSNSHPKARDKNNSAYIDGFFTYLTSQLLHNHNFIHGVDYYGSFLCKKEKFLVNVVDDIEYLSNSDFFHKNKNELFYIDSAYHNELINFDSRNYKKRLNITDSSLNIIELSDIKDIKNLDTIFTENDNISNNSKKNLIFNYNLSSKNSSNSSSTCSSRSSNTDSSESGSIESETDSETSSMDSESEVNAIITEFPVQVICLEKCKNTLDFLIVEGDISMKEWESILLQIIMMLITYQYVFGLTHNDLHTNNIMYIETDKKYLCYKYNGKHFKVPTYGKIYKIIDFGRAVYKFRGNIICSDSYHPQGDAATQYNFEPYFNKNKPRLEPNFSFDLCRLACSLFDFLIDMDEDSPKQKSPVQKLIMEWCKDDKGRNILYKNDGEERYPEFKLYKMIARSVHKHTPQTQLEKSIFEKYIVGRKKINKSSKIINLDELPQYR